MNALADAKTWIRCCKYTLYSQPVPLIHHVQKFMESEGIIVNDAEPMPVDPYSERRKNPQPVYKTPSERDCMHQFLTMDRKVN